MFQSHNMFKLAGCGVIGFIAGIYFDRTKPLPSKIQGGSKLHIGQPLHAATVINPSSNLIPNEPPPNATRAAHIMRFGFPSTDAIRMFDDYILSYDRRNRNANWAFEHLTSQTVANNDKISRAKSEFQEDGTVHRYFRAQNTDFRGSGFDRGHLAAAGNHRLSQDVMDQTFVLSNISPQVGKGFNRDSWNRLEKYTRDLTKKNRNVYVCTGPLYLPRRDIDGKTYIKFQVIGPNQISVPTHFFKVVVYESDNGHFHLESFVMPNQPIEDGVPLQTFHVPIESIERSSGLIFFDKLPNQVFKSVNAKH